MKKIALIFMFAILSLSLWAQNQKVKNLRYLDSQPVHFGFTVGLNYMDFTIHKSGLFFNDTVDFYSIENKIQPGFHLGPIVNFRLGQYFDLRLLLNLSFGQRNLTYNRVNFSGTEGVISELYTMKIASTFIEVPVLIKYKAARMNNMRPYVLLGACPKYDLSAKKAPNEADLPKVQLNQLDYYADMGFGIDWYLPYFKLSTELKYSLGFNDMLKQDGTVYTSAIDKMSSKMFMLSFHFEGSNKF